MDTEEARFALLEAMRGQLASLEGRSSGLVDSLPLEQKRRIRALKAMQESCDEHVRVCREKKKQAEKEMRESCAPLWKSRKEIVCGEREPTVEELPEDSEEEEEVDASEGIQGEEKEEEKGIPDFWSVVLQSHEVLEEMIKEDDQEALSFLQDITCDVLEEEQHGFRLNFYFAENPFFENTVLTKTYYMADDDEPMVEGLEGTEILWKPNKCLTMKTYKKKPKRGGANAKPVKKTEPCDSFFNFFSPPEIPEDAEDMEEEEAEQLQEALEEDYEVGATIRDKLIPQAVLWFTGEAQGYDSDYEEDEDEDYDSEGEGEGDTDGSDEEGEGVKDTAEKPPECKEQ